MSAPAGGRLAGVVAESPAMKEILGLVTRLAEARSAVLLEGESGTGKDLVAHLLHYQGPRRDGPFIRLHCPSVPEDLLESELFGHEKGAFTDARQQKAGKLEMADRGTLYFDQIQDLSLALHAKLLRVVEEKRFERLGGTRVLEVDVRFRLHRFASHIAEHTYQCEKAIRALGAYGGDARAICRRIGAMRGSHERRSGGATLGALDAALAENARIAQL